ncbi:MAG: hypothetical protein QOI84_791, partial [Solirubrobacterales bacterium]|nr:hypothetical protein [Solirubrobacterales bacterium]
ELFGTEVAPIVRRELPGIESPATAIESQGAP